MHLFCKLTKAYVITHFIFMVSNLYTKTTFKLLWIAYEYFTCLLINYYYYYFLYSQ